MLNGRDCIVEIANCDGIRSITERDCYGSFETGAHLDQGCHRSEQTGKLGARCQQVGSAVLTLQRQGERLDPRLLTGAFAVERGFLKPQRLEGRNRGGLQFQTQQDFPHAAIPVATGFDRSHPMSKSLESLPLPYPTSVEPSAELAKDSRFEVVKVLQSSDSSLKKNAPLPLQKPLRLNLL